MCAVHAQTSFGKALTEGRQVEVRVASVEVCGGLTGRGDGKYGREERM